MDKDGGPPALTLPKGSVKPEGIGTCGIAALGDVVDLAAVVCIASEGDCGILEGWEKALF